MNKLWVLLLLCSPAMATSIFIASNGSDANSGLDSGHPVLTLAKAKSLMIAGDTLSVAAGSYTAATNGAFHCSGNSGVSVSAPDACFNSLSGASYATRTIIRASAWGSAVWDAPSGHEFVLGSLADASCGSGYVCNMEFDGIAWDGVRAAQFYQVQNIYIHNGYIKSTQGSSASGFDIGENDNGNRSTDILVEDFLIRGTNRYIYQPLNVDRLIYRRVVGIQDGCNIANCATAGNFIGGTNPYNSTKVSFQNTIIIDTILGTTGLAGGADYWTAYHTNACFPNGSNCGFGLNEWLGVIALNTPIGMTAMKLEASALQAAGASGLSPTFAVNNAYIDGNDPAKDGFSSDCPSCVAGLSMTLEHMTIHHATGGARRGLVYSNLFTDTVSSYIRNTVVFGSGQYAFDPNTFKPTYVSWGSSGSSTWTSGGYRENAATVGQINNHDPTIAQGAFTVASVLFPTRIETGSELALTGSDGGAMGATIVNEYGCTGCFYNDAGSRTLTGTGLWTFPNEAAIKTAACSSSTRAWCGTSATLTQYIWDWLGNASPYDSPPPRMQGNITISGGINWQ